MALLVLLGALCWVQRVVFGFSYFIPVFVFVGCWGPAVLFVGRVFVLGKRELGLGVELSF